MRWQDVIVFFSIVVGTFNSVYPLQEKILTQRNQVINGQQTQQQQQQQLQLQHNGLQQQQMIKQTLSSTTEQLPQDMPQDMKTESSGDLPITNLRGIDNNIFKSLRGGGYKFGFNHGTTPDRPKKPTIYYTQSSLGSLQKPSQPSYQQSSDYQPHGGYSSSEDYPIYSSSITGYSNSYPGYLPIGGYPPNVGYPPNIGGYPPNVGYPPNGGFPPNSGYPGYPPNIGYPPNSGGYPGYPPNSGYPNYPIGGYPTNGGGYPPNIGGYPPFNGDNPFSPPFSNYPPFSNGYPDYPGNNPYSPYYPFLRSTTVNSDDGIQMLNEENIEPRTTPDYYRSDPNSQMQYKFLNNLQGRLSLPNSNAENKPAIARSSSTTLNDLTSLPPFNQQQLGRSH